ncbi:hypothetical protein [Alicyclobacillus sp. SO9]|uniref:hypothetical protein n=1 Tax=Alicyclobacillus sp. SO9 TaxID=2665646 RepID=UPI0018E8C95B|nr:hypothetical protein [Alicyclobacillus sp. SO9]QQE79990.1 hypothetical protein GI364_05830 [Alicyclobacillus sp. SO9]
MGKKDAKSFLIKEKQLFCPICGHDKFWKDEARVEKGIGQFRPDWEAVTLTCEECRHILWFEH